MLSNNKNKRNNSSNISDSDNGNGNDSNNDDENNNTTWNSYILNIERGCITQKRMHQYEIFFINEGK